MKHRTKAGKIYQIGDDHVVVAKKGHVIETENVVKEHATEKTLPKKLKDKLKK